MRKKTFVIHPFLLSVYPVLFLYSHNIGQVAFREIFVPIAIIVGIALPVWCLLGVTLKSFRKSGTIVSLFLILFFSYGCFRTLLGTKAQALLLPSVWIGLLIISTFYIIRNKKTFHTTTAALNVVSCVLIMFPVIGITIYQFNNSGLTGREGGSGHIQAQVDPNSQMNSCPDIYFIILDAYARQDVLRDMYSYDNSEFLNFLREKGFYIADKSMSNYCQTGLVIGSCLNLSYLDSFVKKVGEYNPNRKPLETLIDKSYVVTDLKKRGYESVTFDSGCAEMKFPSADIRLKADVSINIFQNTLKNLTPLPDILTIKKINDPFDIYRRNILHIFESLADIYKLGRKPKFVLAHIEVPHPPFVFGQKGEPVRLESRFNDHDGDWLIRPGRITKTQYRKSYRDQTIFTNKQMKKVVNKILSNSKQPPVVIILGDHGPRSDLIWESPQKTNMKECFSNLGAYYFPDEGAEKLYPEITPVNIFRIIFDHYFHTKFGTLPDKCYFSTAGYLYKFYDVTENLQKE